MTLSNNFEGGTNGTTITTSNSGGTSGSAWDSVGIGTGATNAFSNTYVANGGLAALLSVGATTAGAHLDWKASWGTQTTTYVRFNLYITTYPAAAVRIVNILTGSAALASGLVLGTAGQLQTIDSASGGQLLTSNGAVPLNTWVRIEMQVTHSTTTGYHELRVWNSGTDYDSSASADIHLTSASTLNTAANSDEVRFGITITTTNTTLYLDDIALSSAGWIGPALSTYVSSTPRRHPRRIPRHRCVVKATPYVASVAPPAKAPSAPRRHPHRIPRHRCVVKTAPYVASVAPQNKAPSAPRRRCHAIVAARRPARGKRLTPLIPRRAGVLDVTQTTAGAAAQYTPSFTPGYSSDYVSFIVALKPI